MTEQEQTESLPDGGIAISDCKIDHRPSRGGWSDGHYMCKCFNCQAGFIGDKRATTCADCAYASIVPLRIMELCERLVSSGSVHEKLSESELHEICDFIFQLNNPSNDD